MSKLKIHLNVYQVIEKCSNEGMANSWIVFSSEKEMSKLWEKIPSERILSHRKTIICHLSIINPSFHVLKVA